MSDDMSKKLIGACQNDPTGITAAHIEELLKLGADPAYVTDQKLTALIYLVANGNVAGSEALIKAGADMSHVYADGKSVLDYARESKSPGMKKIAETLETMLERGITDMTASSDPLWKVYNTEAVVQLSYSPRSLLSISDIFNFATQERTRVVENVDTKNMTMSMPQNFRDIGDVQVTAAFEFYKKNGGKIEMEGAIGAFTQSKVDRKSSFSS